MARRPSISFPLPDGRTVGASLKTRGDYYSIQFPHPDEPGKYVEAATGCTSIADAQNEAAKIILKHYTPTMATVAKNVTWEMAVERIKGTTDLRPDSVRHYLSTIRVLRVFLPKSKGPEDITSVQANEFKRQYLAGTYTRGEADGANRYPRSPASCATCLRAFRALWGKKHFRAAKFVSSNPWLDVPYPNMAKKKRVRLPEEAAVQELLSWLLKKYPKWTLPRLFVEVKCVAGCRTLDLCSVRSYDLVGELLHLDASITKTKTDRSIPLPPELAEQLHAVKGKKWLWESSITEGKLHRGAGGSTVTEYTPSRWRYVVQNLFREFNEGRAVAERVRPHDLRARAITMIALGTQSVDATAEALGLDVQTARHYLDAATAFKGSDLMKKFAAVLMPKSPPESPQNSGKLR